MFSRYFKILTGASVVIISSVVVLQLLKKKVHITASITASHVKFDLTENVHNFLSLGSNVAASYKSKVTNFSKAEIPYLQLANDDMQVIDSTPGTITLVAEEAGLRTSVASDEMVVNGITLTPGNRLDIFSIKNEKDKIRLNFSKFQSPIALTNNSSQVRIKSKRCISKGNEVLEKEGWDNDPLYLLNEQELYKMNFMPDGGEIGLTLIIKQGTVFSEDQVLTVRNLKFEEPVLDTNEYNSSVLKGKINIQETEKEISFGKNKNVQFNPNDKFKITELELHGDKVKVVFEGETEDLTLGFNNTSFVPSLLEYLYKNNFLIIVFNTYLVVLSFFISIYRTNKESREKENKS